MIVHFLYLPFLHVFLNLSNRNASTAHANGIFATAGLVFALDKFYTSLDESSKSLADEGEKCTSHRHFIAEYVETILCAILPEYQPTGKVHSWLLTVSSPYKYTISKAKSMFIYLLNVNAICINGYNS